MGVLGACLYGGVAKEFLDITNIGSAFGEMGSEGMTGGQLH
jgi:hypothetical protein